MYSLSLFASVTGALLLAFGIFYIFYDRDKDSWIMALVGGGMLLAGILIGINVADSNVLKIQLAASEQNLVVFDIEGYDSTPKVNVGYEGACLVSAEYDDKTKQLVFKLNDSKKLVLTPNVVWNLCNADDSPPNNA